MSFVIALFVSLLASQSSFAITPDHVKACVDSLGADHPVFTTVELHILIQHKLGDVELPALLKREYFRGEKKLVTLSYRVSERNRSIAVLLRADGLEDEVVPTFFKRINEDLFEHMNVRLEPYTEDPDGPRVLTSRTMRVSNGQRHPLEPGDAFSMFLSLTAILRDRLHEHVVQDAVEFGARGNPEIKF